MKNKTTIRKISEAWNKKLWGFYDLQFPFNPPPIIIPKTMASPNTLTLRQMVQIKASRFVTQPNGKKKRVTKLFSKHEIGKVIHSGGTRIGSFSKDSK